MYIQLSRIATPSFIANIDCYCRVTKKQYIWPNDSLNSVHGYKLGLQGKRNTSRRRGSVISCRISSNRGWFSHWTRVYFDPVKKLSTTMTKWPSFIRRSTRCEPTKPGFQPIYIIYMSLFVCVNSCAHKYSCLHWLKSLLISYHVRW